ncbi:MAG TPA: cytochrome c [Myxococcales bacterium]|nr:cytochrome c [Myxococcales bacterium]
MIRFAALAACCALAGACADTTIVDPMERQPRGRAFAANPFFEDGRAMRTPPPGTVPRERIVQNPALTQGRVGDNDVTEIPIQLTRTVLETGHKKFDIYCGTCHGLLGDGRSPVAANMSLRLPPNLHERRGMAVGHYYQVIANGFGLMPGYAAELTVQERWAVVAYLRALQLSQNAPLALAPPDEREKLSRERR